MCIIQTQLLTYSINTWYLLRMYVRTSKTVRQQPVLKYLLQVDTYVHTYVHTDLKNVY